MANLFAIAALFLVYAAVCRGDGVSHVADFVDPNEEFEFVYHDRDNLLLTLYAESCYLTHVTAADVDLTARLITEETIKQAILSGSGATQELTLEQMRYRYQDRLADFHCLDKTIYDLHVSLSNGDGGDD